MATTDILYITLIVAIVVITVTLVWLANDLRGLIKSLRKSADDTAAVTKEIREKVLMVSEALDRAGAAASSIIGMIENAIEEIKEKKDAIVSSIGLLSGAGKFIKAQRENSTKDDEEEEPEEDEEKEEINEKHGKGEKVEMEVNKETKLAKSSKKDDSKPSVDSVARPKAPTSKTVGVPTGTSGKKEISDLEEDERKVDL